eukprot:2753524-Alexandrium_andersonii.AAC.1
MELHAVSCSFLRSWDPPSPGPPALRPGGLWSHQNPPNWYPQRAARANRGSGGVGDHPAKRGGLQ